MKFTKTFRSDVNLCTKKPLRKFEKKSTKNICSETFNKMKAKNFYQQTRNFFKSYNVGKCNNLIRKVGKVSPDRYTVPDLIDKPSYYENASRPIQSIETIEIKNEEQIQGMRKACKLAANILKKCSDIVKVSRSFFKVSQLSISRFLGRFDNRRN